MLKEGEVIITSLPQKDGRIKNRPAVVITKIPPKEQYLICGISTRLYSYDKELDEIITVNDDDFDSSGLTEECIIRLEFHRLISEKEKNETIGFISKERHQRIFKKLSDYLHLDLA